MPYQILSLADSPGYHWLSVAGLRVGFRGFGRNYPGFLAATLTTPASLVVVGHLQLVPAALGIGYVREKPKLVLVAHGIEVWDRSSILARTMLRRVDRVICVSRFTAGKVTRLHGIPSNRVAVVHPCQDPELDGHPPSQVVRKHGGRDILTVARLSRADRYKGVQHVIKALPSIRLTVPAVQYTIVGKGKDEGYLLRLACTLGLEGAVEVVSQVADSALAELYEQCDVFVMPSLKEGLGIVFLEAMAHGKPVVAANHGGTPEAVVEGRTGFLIDYGDLQALSQYIVRLLQDERLRSEMGESARRCVSEHFTFERFSERATGAIAGLLRA